MPMASFYAPKNIQVQTSLICSNLSRYSGLGHFAGTSVTEELNHSTPMLHFHATLKTSQTANIKLKLKKTLWPLFIDGVQLPQG